MAEIRVERKKGIPAWAWILILLLIGAIAWFAYTMVG